MSTVKLCFLSVAVVLLPTSFAHALSNLDHAEKYAWSENSGWINFNATGGGVVVHRAFLSGYAWAENIGWIKIGADGAGPYDNTSAANWGVNRNALNGLSGYAWSETAGWINFDPTNGGVTIDPSTGEFNGFAWSENLGWIHLRSDTALYGPLLIVPQLPDTTSVDHEVGIPSTERRIIVEWSGATGNDLGLGYSYMFDDSETGTPDPVIDLVHTTDPHSITGPPLVDGDSHYFHLRSCDTVGNCSDTLTLGPYTIDTTSPRPAGVQSVADTGDGVLDDGESARTGFTQIYLTFDEAMLDPSGDGDSGDVTNPANYLLVEAGADGVIETLECSGGIGGDDVEFTIDDVDWDASTATARATIDGSDPLPRGAYRFIACGTLTDEAGNALDGNADGIGGDDAFHHFTVTETNALTNPTFDHDEGLTGWTDNSTDVSWDTLDAGSAPTSGAAALFGFSPGVKRLSQCVAADDTVGHALGVSIAVYPFSDDDPTITVSLIAYDAADCGGTALATTTRAFVQTVADGEFQDLEFWAEAEAGMQSLEVVVSATVVQFGSETHVDDVFLIEELFGDGFESGDTSGWSSSTP